MIRVALALGWGLHTAHWLGALLRARGAAAARHEWGRETAIRAAMLFLLASAILAPFGGWWDISPPVAVALLAVFFAGQALATGGRAALGDAWSIGTRPRPEAPPRRHGLYATVRHPIYVGTTVAVGAQAMLLQNLPSLLLFVAAVAVAIVKILAEERWLRASSGR